MLTVLQHNPTLLDHPALASGAGFPVRNPATGAFLAEGVDHSVADMQVAIDAAYTAQQPWAARTAKERCDILLRWYALMVDHADDRATILTAETGKPLAEGRGEILYGASFIQWFADEGRRIYGDVIPGHQRDKRIIVLKQPVDVVGAITP